MQDMAAAAEHLPRHALRGNSSLAFSQKTRLLRQRPKARARKLSSGAASGADSTSYRDSVNISARDLAHPFNSCINDVDAPSSWLTATLIGLPKPDKPASDPPSGPLEHLYLRLLASRLGRRHHAQWSTNSPSLHADNGTILTTSVRALSEKLRHLERCSPELTLISSYIKTELTIML